MSKEFIYKCELRNKIENLSGAIALIKKALKENNGKINESTIISQRTKENLSDYIEKLQTYIDEFEKL